MSAFKTNSRDIDLAFAKIHVQVGILGEALSYVNENLEGRMQAVIDVRVVSISCSASGAVTLKYASPDGMHGHAEILHLIRCPLTACCAKNMMRVPMMIGKAINARGGAHRREISHEGPQPVNGWYGVTGRHPASVI